ncbi:MAG: LmeA family phospholipid-binding protein [Anaerolineaceae bacterium]|nr:LmeA family phospholipid-binding protein [Anaerolineaceae bacterium]
MRLPFTRLVLVLVVLLAASLACNFPNSDTAGSSTAVPLTDQEFQQLQERLRETLENSSGEVTFTLTEQQLNTMISAKMAEQKDQIISEPGVKLTKGNMEVYGKLTQAGITLKLTVILKPGVNASGSPKLDIVDIQMGGIPVPDEIKNQLGNLVDQAFQEYLSNQNQGFKASKITIDEGKMTVTGTIQQP